MKAGSVVVAIDLRGTGETRDAKPNEKIDPLLGDWKRFSLAYLLGQSLVGLHTEDVLAARNFVAFYKTPANKPRPVHLIAVGRHCIPALHAAALMADKFASVTLRNPPADWSTTVSQPVPSGQLTNTVHNALSVYDLSDLRRVLGAKLK